MLAGALESKRKEKNNQSDNRKINEFVIKDVLWKEKTLISENIVPVPK